MQRWTSVVVGLLMATALVAALIALGRPGGWRRVAKAAPSASASASAGAPSAPAASPNGSSEPGLSDDPLIDPPDPGSEWTPDGGKPLPAGAPGSVGFGVILFTYQGAQLAPAGARTKDEALEKAKGIVEEAKKDFAEAAKKGDRGSTSDAGRLPRGVLEPDVELILFSLEKGAIHPEPIDTPRGFWVVKRID